VTHLAFGVFWVVIAVLVLLAPQANVPWGQNAGMLAAFAGMLAVYNFLRFGINWMVRRRPRSEADFELPRCPKCGRRMRLVDLGPQVQAEKDRYKLHCCGYQLQIDDDEERRRIMRIR
jgi:hypothetical protein